MAHLGAHLGAHSGAHLGAHLGAHSGAFGLQFLWGGGSPSAELSAPTLLRFWGTLRSHYKTVPVLGIHVWLHHIGNTVLAMVLGPDTHPFEVSDFCFYFWGVFWVSKLASRGAH